MQRDSILIRSNEMQQYSGVYLLQNYSTCFGCLSHPSSWVHQTVTAASGTGHITCQSNNLPPAWPQATLADLNSVLSVDEDNLMLCIDLVICKSSLGPPNLGFRTLPVFMRIRLLWVVTPCWMLIDVVLYPEILESVRQLFAMTVQCNSSPCRHVEDCNITTGRSVY